MLNSLVALDTFTQVLKVLPPLCDALDKTLPEGTDGAVKLSLLKNTVLTALSLTGALTPVLPAVLNMIESAVAAYISASKVAAASSPA